MRKMKRVMKIFFTVIVAMLILLLIIYINHQIHLKGENELRLPLGKMVEVDLGSSLAPHECFYAGWKTHVGTSASIQSP